MKRTIFALAMVASTMSFASVISTFDTDADGWTMVTFAAGGPYNVSPTNIGGLTWQSTGGNPDGYIERTDVEGGAMMFRAPNKFHGDQSVMLGGTITFDIQSDYDDRTVDSNVVIKGNGLTLVGQFTNPVQDAGWFSRGVVLDAANFRKNTQGGAAVSGAELLSALSNVSDLFIGGEMHTGFPAETTGIDNVKLEAVPEPASMILLASGVAAFMARRRRNA